MWGEVNLGWGCRGEGGALFTKVCVAAVFCLSPKELLKCSKKAAVPNQADIKSLETVVALVEVGVYSLIVDNSMQIDITGYSTVHQLFKRRL